MYVVACPPLKTIPRQTIRPSSIQFFAAVCYHSWTNFPLSAFHPVLAQQGFRMGSSSADNPAVTALRPLSLRDLSLWSAKAFSFTACRQRSKGWIYYRSPFFSSPLLVFEPFFQKKFIIMESVFLLANGAVVVNRMTIWIVVLVTSPPSTGKKVRQMKSMEAIESLT